MPGADDVAERLAEGPGGALLGAVGAGKAAGADAGASARVDQAGPEVSCGVEPEQKPAKVKHKTTRMGALKKFTEMSTLWGAKKTRAKLVNQQ